MALLQTHPGANIAYGNILLNDDYEGFCWEVRRSSDSATQDIGFDGKELDVASLESFAGADTITLVTRYDQSGNGHDQTSPAGESEPEIVYDADQERYVINFDEAPMQNADAPSIDTYTTYFSMKAAYPQPRATAWLSSGETGSRQPNIVFANDGDDIYIFATTTDGPQIGITNIDQWFVFAASADRNVTDGSFFYKDQSQLGADFLFNGSGSLGYTTGANGSLGGQSNITVQVEIVYPTNHDKATVNTIQGDLLSELSLDTTPFITVTKDGDPVERAVVTFLEMDAFAMDGFDETSVFQNVTQLADGATQAYVTGADGVATFTGTIDDTKVQVAKVFYAEYVDGEWKAVTKYSMGFENVDLTAPA